MDNLSLMQRSLAQSDPEIAAAIANETTRQAEGLELIASENFVSTAVLEAAGSVMTNKYAEGYPGKRYYGGCEFVDVAEALAIARAKALFGADHVNVQPHSGAQANMAVYLTLLKPGDVVLGMNLAHGGHLTHGHPLNFSGKLYTIVPYGVRQDDERLDYEEFERLAHEHKPKVIIAGASSYSRVIDFERMGKVARAVGAPLVVDMAHIAGLVAGGAHPSPAGLAQVMTTSTHKTLRGPRGGMVLCDANLRRQIDRGVFPGSQGGPMMHVIAGKAVMLKEAATPEFSQHAHQVVANAKALAASLMDTGMTLISGGTDNHLVLVDVRPMGLNGVQAADALEAAGIVVNSNPIPFDTLPPREGGGIRFGTPAITSRGLVEADMVKIGQAMARVLAAPTDQAVLAAVKREVQELCAKHPAPGIPVH